VQRQGVRHGPLVLDVADLHRGEAASIRLGHADGAVELDLIDLLRPTFMIAVKRCPRDKTCDKTQLRTR
jgi:hypothetical protein